MKIAAAFLRLIRWPNLVFILLTQVMFEYCIVKPIFNSVSIVSSISGKFFVGMMISYVFIAAAGYIINDYFDLNIDRINKPSKVVVSSVINRRWVLLWHTILSAIAVLIGLYIDLYSGATPICTLAAFVNVSVLFLYSSSLKKKFLVGNVTVAAITAWGIIILTWCESNHFFLVKNLPISSKYNRLVTLTFLYAGFAFIVSLIREVIKDMEDVEGDRIYGCKTMPIVWGLNTTKVFVAVWLIVLIATLVIIQFYAIQYGWWISILYAIVLIISPLIWIFKKLFKAQTANDFHQLSTAVKLVMLTGILSMIFFKFPC